MAAKRSASPLQNQPNKKTLYGNCTSIEDIYLTVDTQEISEWYAKELKPSNQADGIKLLLIDEDEDASIENFTISEQKKTKMYTNQNKEFVKFEMIKKNKDSSETFLILKQDALHKFARLLPQLQKHYVSALQGQKVNVRYKLTDDIYVSCNDQYLCVDLRVFYTPKGDMTGILRPTRRGILFNLMKRSVYMKLLKI